MEHNPPGGYPQVPPRPDSHAASPAEQDDDPPPPFEASGSTAYHDTPTEEKSPPALPRPPAHPSVTGPSAAKSPRRLPPAFVEHSGAERTGLLPQQPPPPRRLPPAVSAAAKTTPAAAQVTPVVQTGYVVAPPAAPQERLPPPPHRLPPRIAAAPLPEVSGDKSDNSEKAPPSPRRLPPVYHGSTGDDAHLGVPGDSARSSSTSLLQLDPNAPDSFVRDPHKLVAYIVPFPPPTNLPRHMDLPPVRFLIYTPPPPPLLKPGSGQKEGISNKMQRKWQKEVRDAHATNAKVTSWRGLKSRITKGVHWAMHKTTSADVDFLTRIPQDGEKYRGRHTGNTPPATPPSARTPPVARTPPAGPSTATTRRPGDIAPSRDHGAESLSAKFAAPKMDIQLQDDSSSKDDRNMQDNGPLSPLDPISPWPPTDTSPPDPLDPDDPAPISYLNPADLPSAKEVYGSLAVLLTYLLFGVYLVWAFAPPSWLDAVGWTWYPSREWAVIVPCWLMVVVLLTYWAYPALGMFLTPAFDSPSIITDTHANIPAPDPNKPAYYWRFADPTSVPEAVDLPIDLVNRVLYPPRKRPQQSGLLEIKPSRQFAASSDILAAPPSYSEHEVPAAPPSNPGPSDSGPSSAGPSSAGPSSAGPSSAGPSIPAAPPSKPDPNAGNSEKPKPGKLYIANPDDSPAVTPAATPAEERPSALDSARPSSEQLPERLSSDDSHAEDEHHEGDTTNKTVKLEELVMIYPPSMNMTPEELRTEFVNSLMRTKSKAQRDAVIATGLLPVTAALDWALMFVGWVFGGLLEVDAVWAAASIKGAKTARSVTKRLSSSTVSGDATSATESLKLSFIPSHRADPLAAYLTTQCVARNIGMFSVPPGGARPTADDVLDSIGWQLSGVYEDKNWEDEAWERNQVRSDVERTFAKAAKAWDKWVAAYQRNPEKAVKK